MCLLILSVVGIYSFGHFGRCMVTSHFFLFINTFSSLLRVFNGYRIFSWQLLLWNHFSIPLLFKRFSLKSIYFLWGKGSKIFSCHLFSAVTKWFFKVWVLLILPGSFGLLRYLDWCLPLVQENFQPLSFEVLFVLSSLSLLFLFILGIWLNVVYIASLYFLSLLWFLTFLICAIWLFFYDL